VFLIPRYALKLTYLGTNYKGYQRQPRVKTIEKELLQALEKCGLIQKNKLKQYKYEYASRTDASVHAISQVIALTLPSEIGEIVINKVNQHLPQDIKIIGFTQVPSDFSPRHHAIYRHYKYVTYYKGENLIQMKQLAKYILGNHDFKNISSKKTDKNTFRRLLAINIQKNKDFIHVDVIGRSFCRGMIRKILTLLLEGGKRNITHKDLSLLLNPIIKNIIPLKYASPNGLILYDIRYSVTFYLIPKAVINFLEHIKYELSGNNLLEQIFLSFKSYFMKANITLKV